MVRIIALTCIVVALTMLLLELVPFVVFIPAFALGMFGVGLTVGDGLFILSGIVVVFWNFSVFLISQHLGKLTVSAGARPRCRGVALLSPSR